MNAVIAIQFTEYVMDENEALVVFKALSHARIIRYDYVDSKKQYYYAPMDVSMRYISEEDLAMATIYTAARENS